MEIVDFRVIILLALISMIITMANFMLFSKRSSKEVSREVEVFNFPKWAEDVVSCAKMCAAEAFDYHNYYKAIELSYECRKKLQINESLLFPHQREYYYLIRDTFSALFDLIYQIPNAETIFEYSNPKDVEALKNKLENIKIKAMEVIVGLEKIKEKLPDLYHTQNLEELKNKIKNVEKQIDNLLEGLEETQREGIARQPDPFFIDFRTVSLSTDGTFEFSLANGAGANVEIVSIEIYEENEIIPIRATNPETPVILPVNSEKNFKIKLTRKFNKGDLHTFEIRILWKYSGTDVLRTSIGIVTIKASSGEGTVGTIEECQERCNFFKEIGQDWRETVYDFIKMYENKLKYYAEFCSEIYPCKFEVYDIETDEYKTCNIKEGKIVCENLIYSLT